MARVKIEPASDPVWAQRGRLLYEFLEEPRTWKEMRRWARDDLEIGTERMRHTLAHLGNLFRVLKGQDKTVRWVRLGVPAEGEPLEWTDKSQPEL